MFKWRSNRINQEDKLHSSSHEFCFVYLSSSLFLSPFTHTSTSTYSLLYLSLHQKIHQSKPTPNVIFISCVSFSFFSYLISMETTNHLFRSHFFVLSWIILCITVLLPSFFFLISDVIPNLLRFYYFSLPFEHSSSL